MKRALVSMLLLAFSLGTVASARTMTLDDVKSIVTISDVHLRPDGKQILYVASRGNYTNDTVERALTLYDLASGTQRVLSDGRSGLASPAWSPDGTYVAFLATGVDDVAQLWLMDMRGGDPRKVSDAPRGVDTFAWRADSRTLLYTTADAPPNESAVRKHLDAFKVGEQAFNVRSAPPVMRVWTAGVDAGANAVAPANEQTTPLVALPENVSSGATAFARSDAQRPSELYYQPSPNAPARRLTDANAAVAALEFGKTESIAWQTASGSAWSGALTHPPGIACAAPKPCPLVLLVAGGPVGEPGTFSALAQLLAARGYAVLRPVTADTVGGAAADDIAAGVTALETRGIADPQRVAVGGWSYGGYVTAWLIGHQHFWEAAVAGSPITNWVDQYALSQSNVLTRNRFGGASPFVGDGMQHYLADSPMTYAWSITTPTLILADVHDAQVPITNAYDLYHALADRGTPVQFIAYPVSENYPADPVQQLDVLRRWVEWTAAYLK